jgi:hypothetical protein
MGEHPQTKFRYIGTPLGKEQVLPKCRLHIDISYHLDPILEFSQSKKYIIGGKEFPILGDL